ncbi:MAG: tRNA-dihydrouridine synthase family protein [Eubacteriales bacterium]|nr:tRNA-dihydrouridine synthase family protein [Eubacteriales bacterium]
MENRDGLRVYFAPLEGITGYSYRNVHRSFFTGIDKYYAPFVAPNYTHHFKTKEKLDVDPGNNAGVRMVPQILSNQEGDFLWAAEELYRLGYREINLNLGCPMPTVVRKKRGAGQLGDLEELDRFLEQICRGMEERFGLRSAESPEAEEGRQSAGDPSGVLFSIKTRIGLTDAEEAGRLLKIYNRYPVSELTVHPRTRKDMYGGRPDLEVFAAFLEGSTHPVVYNGDLCTAEDVEHFRDRFPACRAVMIGRGLIADPALARRILGGAPLCRDELRRFHDALYKSAVESLPGTTPVLGRMKELWFYMGRNFRNADRYLKEIRKAKTLPQYCAAVRTLFVNAQFAVD